MKELMHQIPVSTGKVIVNCIHVDCIFVNTVMLDRVQPTIPWRVQAYFDTQDSHFDSSPSRL